jgi:MoaA/NifB/PqqE/SkfB family radical SAM enzyme
LDGGYSKTHDSIRGEGVFARLSGFMRYLKQRKAKDKKPFLTVNTVIVKNNVLELVNILNLASAWGCNNITYEVFLSDNADLRQNQLTNPFWVRGDDLKVLDSQIQKIIAIKNSPTAPIYVANTMDYLNNIVNYYKNMLEPGIFSCRNGRDFLSVCVDGKVCICDHCLGDLKKDDFLTIWNKSSTDNALRAVACCQRPCMMNCMVGGVEYYGKKE